MTRPRRADRGWLLWASCVLRVRSGAGGCFMGPHEQSSPHPGDDERARDARSVRLSSTVFAALETHLGSQQVSRVIYGAILGLALTLGLERHPPGAGVVVATLFATAIA